MIALPNRRDVSTFTSGLYAEAPTEETTVVPSIAFRDQIQVTAETDGGLGIVPRKSFQFSAGETQVRLDPLPEGTKRVLITADVHSSQTLVELLLTLDALNRLKYRVPVVLTLPYLPYSRQDRACAPGESFALSMFVVSLVPHLCSEDTVVTWDAHSDVADYLFERCFDGTFGNVNAVSLLLLLNHKHGVTFDPSTIVVAPDKGAVKRATEVQQAFGLSETVYATKVRNPDDGQILRTEVPEDVDYRGKKLLIVDDICDGGRTFIELAKVLRKYEPESIDLYVTHGIFSKGFEPFGDLIDHFYVANLLPNNRFYHQLPDNLNYIRTAA